MEALRRTPLYAREAAIGARFAPFAGFEVPLQYSSIAEEHLAVRHSAGVFDVSHMIRLELEGPDAFATLERRLTNELARIGPGSAQYTLLTDGEGGVLDDLIVYRLDEERFLLVVNARAREVWCAELPQSRDRSDETAMLAVQGPQALALLEVEIDRFAVREASVLGVGCLLMGTGYTGERGCELVCRAEDAEELLGRVLERGVVPCGLGARDTLRLEACLPLAGQDLTPEHTPIEAGLGFACALEKDFPGVDRLRRQAAEGPAVLLVAFAMEEWAIPRAGMPIAEGGEVSSGGYSPLLEQGIGLAYVPRALAEPGTRLTIDVRGRAKAARVVAKPIYRPKG